MLDMFYKFIVMNFNYCNTVCTLVETKIGCLVFSSSPPVGTVVIRILPFFVPLYLLFLPSHRYRTKTESFVPTIT
jgi:hypothetical protein